ncbi:MAG: hypothetical protein ACYCSF_12075 [Acidimicrobiales bacterium]
MHKLTRAVSSGVGTRKLAFACSAVALLAGMGLALPLAGVSGATIDRARPSAAALGGSFVPVTPARLADTRPGSGAAYAGQTLTPKGILNVQVTGQGGVPASGVSAAVLNVTAVGPTAAGFLTVFPQGTAMPTASNLNFAPGVNVPNLVTVPLSATGMASIYNSAGNTNVVVDVDGYYTSTPAADGSGLYNSLSPTRVLGNLTAGQAIAPNSSAAVTVAGNGANDGVPANASAVVVNVTAAQGTAPSFLTVYPAGGTQPLASNVNFSAGQVIANRVTVGVGMGGQIEVYNHAGVVNVDVDIDGYYSGSGGTGSVFVPITPVRLTDTRVGMNGTPIPAGSPETFSLTNSSIPATASGVAANFTVIPGAAPGYVTVYPVTDATNPVASDINWAANETPAVPNFTIADTAGTGKANVFNSHGDTINLVIDAFGYFAGTASSSGGPSFVSSSASASSYPNGFITVTYSEPVNCATVSASDYTIDSPNGTPDAASQPGCMSPSSTGYSSSVGFGGFATPLVVGDTYTITSTGGGPADAAGLTQPAGQTTTGTVGT